MHLPKLQTTLYANAGFSLLSGLLLLTFAEPISAYLIQLPAVVFVVTGVGLLLFAADVFLVARKLPNSMKRASLILWADIIWVVATPLVIVLLGEKVTTTGNWLLVDIAIVVGVLAILEFTGIRLERAVRS